QRKQAWPIPTNKNSAISPPLLSEGQNPAKLLPCSGALLQELSFDHTSRRMMARRPGAGEERPWKLAEHARLGKGKVVGVVVLDGWGEAPPDPFNCIHVADTPTLDALKKGAPERWRLIKAHGTAVGLPTDDDMGNSEVGHNALGAGQIYAQGAKLVDLALASGKIYEGEGFKYIQQSFETGTLHLIGLLSDGGVHSRIDQLQLLLKGASEHGAKRIRVHILTDGRDVLDGSSVTFVETLENDLAKLREKGVDARIASGGGRMYVTMDRYEV
uniref:phosphoglycerate mutase (2,3-diphosphoglycerate-independent) n=1 Tax=Aegilops tauschii subsp. strangulata TaxID=200361 RepID=A0A453I605_AEGTS